jgi:hypothetical protein
MRHLLILGNSGIVAEVGLRGVQLVASKHRKAINIVLTNGSTISSAPK